MKIYIKNFREIKLNNHNTHLIKTYFNSRSTHIPITTYTSRKFLNLSLKNYGAKYKTTIKNLNNDSNTTSENTNQPKTSYKTKITSLEEEKLSIKKISQLSKDDRDKILLIDLRNSIINLDESRPNKFAIWLLIHSLPSLFLFQYLPNVIWVYQIFWIGASIGLNLSAYEFYSSDKEKKIMSSHLNFCLLLSIFTIFLGILSVHKEDVTIPLTTLNFVMIYFTFSRRKFEFFIPTWIKYSLRKFFPFMMIMYLAAVVNMKNKEHIPTKQYCKTTNDDVLTLYYRYIREMSKIITEIKNENPNVEYIKNQLKEGEINLEGKKRTTFENLSNYL